MEILPAIEEANSISEEMDKKMKFEALIVSSEARGELKGRPQVLPAPLPPLLCLEMSTSLVLWQDLNFGEWKIFANFT